MSLVRLLTLRPPLTGGQRFREWFSVGVVHSQQGLSFWFIPYLDGEVVLAVSMAGDTEFYHLPLAEPLRYRIMARLEMLPRAIEYSNGRPRAVLLEYVDLRRTGKCQEEVTEP